MDTSELLTGLPKKMLHKQLLNAMKHCFLCLLNLAECSSDARGSLDV